MSLNSKAKLVQIAKEVCRELRKNSTERLLWEKVRNKRLLGRKFYRQYPIFHDMTGKETFFVADFYCFTDKLIIELDGEYHKYRLKKDAERTNILNHLGLDVLRFSNDEIVNNLEEVMSEIKQHIVIK